jgi:small subunit ribosomal protein S19e
MVYDHSNSVRNDYNMENSIYEITPEEYNAKLSEILRGMPEFKMPEWAGFVKTGVAKNRPPFEAGFWFNRAASILRQIYLQGVVGVGRLRTRYGSKQNRGMKPEKFKKSSGKIIRVILQQAEAAGLIEKYNVSGSRAGRRLTEKGKELLEGLK